jgi:hypothetical protein
MQAGILGIERLILMTSVGCGSSKVAVSKDIYKLFEETLQAKEKAENLLKLYTNMVRVITFLNILCTESLHQTGLDNCATSWFAKRSSH